MACASGRTHLLHVGTALSAGLAVAGWNLTDVLLQQSKEIGSLGETLKVLLFAEWLGEFEGEARRTQIFERCACVELRGCSLR